MRASAEADHLLPTEADTGGGRAGVSDSGGKRPRADDVFPDDPLDDIIIGAVRNDNGEYDEGRVYVYHGPLTETGPADCPK